MKILAILLVPLGLIAGLASGHFLAPEPELVEEEEKIEGEKEARKKPPKLDLSKADYAKLDKHFIIPVIEDGVVTALVVITMAIEVNKESRDLVFEHEPKLRAEFLNVFFNHAQSGGFSGVFIHTQAMNDLRGSLNAAAWSVLGDAAHQVLITSLTRQDV